MRLTKERKEELKEWAESDLGSQHPVKLLLNEVEALEEDLKEYQDSAARMVGRYQYEHKRIKTALEELAYSVSEALLLDEELAEAWGDLEKAMNKANSVIRTL
jgi:hypothetical protein